MATAIAAPLGAQVPLQGNPILAPPAQSSSLYVGELLPEVNEAVLFERFNSVGPVTSIRVCRDAITRRSLGYAYVNFQIAADAERALDTLNFEPILGKPCRIMWCQRDPSVRRSGVGNVFVKGLEPSIDNKALYDAFSIFGNILSCKVVTDNNGQSVGRGFVHFETAQAATEAIEKANGTLLKDQKIAVLHFKSRKERLEEYGKAEHTFKNVFVKSLPEDVDETTLRNMFQEFGEITSSVIMHDQENGQEKSKGFGFVCFLDPNSAKNAVDAYNGKEINGHKLYVGRAMKKAERSAQLRREYENRRKDMQQRSRGVNLYVKNLEEDVDDDKLRESFAEYGQITSARVMRDEKSNTRGFGFVCFSSQEEATKAITEMNGRMIGNKPLYVALAQPKEERRQHLNQQYRQRVQFNRNPGFMPQAPGFMPPQQMMYLNTMPQYAQRGNPYFPNTRYQQPQGRFPPQQPFGGQPQQFGQRPSAQNLQGFPRIGGAPRMNTAPRPAQPPRPQRIPSVPNARYTGAARNIPVAPAAAQLPAPPASQGIQELITIIATADPERQKQMLGDQLYPLVATMYPQNAGKLTGMLLQMENSELVHLLEDQTALTAEVNKANTVLEQHAAGGRPQ